MENKTGNTNTQIKCDVTNCSHHCGGQECGPNQIKVGPASAVTKSDTICGTFKQKN